MNQPNLNLRNTVKHKLYQIWCEFQILKIALSDWTRIFRFFSIFCVLKIVCVRNGYLKFFSNCMIFKISKRAVTYPKYQKIIKILKCSFSKLTNLAIITTYSI